MNYNKPGEGAPVWTGKPQPPRGPWDCYFEMEDCVVFFRMADNRPRGKAVYPGGECVVPAEVFYMKDMPRVSANHPWLKEKDVFADTPEDVARRERQEAGMRLWAYEHGLLPIGDQGPLPR